MYSHILFDNDGTIVDSEILAVDVMLEMLKPYGLEMDRAVYSGRFPGLLDYQILEILRDEQGIEVPTDFIARLHQQHHHIFDHQLQVIPGMDAIFQGLKVPKSMVSNGSVEHVERCLRRVGLFEHLDGQIFSAFQVEKPKPHPDVYLHALESLSLHARQAVVVEDSPTGVKAAKAAGLFVVGFLGASHVSDGHEIHLMDRGADIVVSDAKALHHFFNKHHLVHP